MLLFVLLALAAYRIVRLISRDLLFASWRHAWYRRFPPDEFYRRFARQPGRGWVQGTNPVRPTHPLGQLVQCAWCSGVWVSAAVVALACVFVTVPYPWLTFAAVATAVGFLAELDR